MAFILVLLPSSPIQPVKPPRLSQLQIRCKRSEAMLKPPRKASKPCELQEFRRRSANYHPSIWDHKVLESIKSPFTGKKFVTRLEELTREVSHLIKVTEEPLAQLEIINSIQRLGVAYHFEKEIEEVLERVHVDGNDDLYGAALYFRLLRQHTYGVSSDIFSTFKDKEGRFKASLSEDEKGLLSLYEAAHLGMDGEEILEEGMRFSNRNLTRLMGRMEINVAKQVQHTLDIPLHWRMLRLEAKNFINVYETQNDANLVLLELAKLDFNVVQSIHQSELSELSRWWIDLGLGQKLSFSRDRLVENYLWAMGINFEPQFSKCRKGLTKLVCILTVIDDIYDIYGSLNELELFTEAVDRWNIEAMEKLPDYMKICYLALHNLGNEMAYDILKDHGFNIIQIIKKEWTSLCKAYLVEAKWFTNGYTPTLDEYLSNAWISVGGPLAMVLAYYLQGRTITKESIDCLKHGSKLIYWASLITRLSDDLGTSKAEMERGDVPKSVECHANEAGVSHECAREHIKQLVSDSWKKLNEESIKTPLSKFVNTVTNMARTAQCIFQHGDGIGASNGVTKDRIISLFIEPI